MAHFAELNEANEVLRIIVIANEELLDDDGREDEGRGIGFCRALLGGQWKQCSYNGTIRGAFPGPGWTYDPVNDVFVAPPSEEDATE